MAPRLSRRMLLNLGTLGAAALTTAACSATAATPSLTARPKPTPTPTMTPSPKRPASRASYGPNGTHFPADVPWPGDTAATDLVAECDWVDISRKVQGLTASQVAAGVIIRVKPGTLPGAGAKSSSRAALSGVGQAVWTRNVLIVPRDGFGSVTISSTGIRFDQCARLSFFGFVSAGGFALTRCVSLQLGWSRFEYANITRGGRDLALYELVLGFRQNEEDTVGVRPTETFEMTNISRYGCVFGPSVKPAGSGAHCDTVQLEGTGTGSFGPFTSVDCIDYGSSNAVAVIHDRVVRAEYHHCLLLGEQLPWRVYPLRSGDYQGNPNAFAGGCRDVRLYDSVVAGPIGRLGYTEVHNTSLSYSPAANQQPRVSGAWTVDTGISGWTREQIMGLQEIPDYEIPTLRSLWRW